MLLNKPDNLHKLTDPYHSPSRNFGIDQIKILDKKNQLINIYLKLEKLKFVTYIENIM
jgi:hypothetical protein